MTRMREAREFVFARRGALLLCAAAASASFAAVDDAMPDRASGAFVQRKTLADVDVTITSKGRYEFEKGRFFAWRTVEPLPSTFVATPTNYSMTVNGRTTTRRLKNDVASIAGIFEIKEVKDFVKEVTAVPETGFPRRLTVAFKNGDRLEIEFADEAAGR